MVEEVSVSDRTSALACFPELAIVKWPGSITHHLSTIALGSVPTRQQPKARYRKASGRGYRFAHPPAAAWQFFWGWGMIPTPSSKARYGT
ncbi:hypothetical protein HJFPF1_03150 [Paramyrothecium foliicola]|nr:hypothetical protein HJFPF1_03150 [Paramyrothecium foliicola]